MLNVFVETERKIGGGRECPRHLSLETYSPAQPALPPTPHLWHCPALHNHKQARRVCSCTKSLRLQRSFFFSDRSQIFEERENDALQWKFKFGSLIWMSSRQTEYLFDVLVCIVSFCLFCAPLRTPLPHSLPPHTASTVNKPFCISGVSSIFKFHFWFHSEWIPCDDSAYLKQSNKMNISRRFLLECSSVTAYWILACGEKRGSGFQLNPWGGCKTDDSLVWQLTKNY